MPGNSLFSRAAQIQQVDQSKIWDILVIGGGATGLGVALDAASRGLSTILFEQHDFAKGTSSRSTKLIHGGVRYLAQGDVKLVYSALHERAILEKNARHVIKKQSFIIPCYNVWDAVKYSVGLRLYDLLAGGFGFGMSRFLSKKKVAGRLHNVQGKSLVGGVEYFDGQFDDSRLAINIAQTAIEHGATLLNYFKVVQLTRDNGKLTGATVKDVFTGEQFTMKAKSVINATGVFVDDILKMDNPIAKALVRPSQGVHLVIDKSFLAGNSAMLIPNTADGRVLFVVPWYDHLVVGTTDTPLNSHAEEPIALDAEIAFILDTVAQYLERPPARKDVLSVFAGLRPLAAPKEGSASTKELSRDHKLIVSASGLVTITGGKWTTYRKMAEETVDLVQKNNGGDKQTSDTRNIALHGSRPPSASHLSAYGTDEDLIMMLVGEQPELKNALVNGHGYTLAQVVWAVRSEMAVTVEDVLARRLRLLFLDASAAISAAPIVAGVMQRELGWDDTQKEEQLESFYKIAYHYKIN